MKLLLFLAALVFIYSDVFQTEAQRGTPVLRCGRFVCPRNTTYCLKLVNTTTDGANFVYRISCLNSNMTTLASFNLTRPNPIDNGFFQLNLQGFALAPVRRTPF